LLPLLLRLRVGRLALALAHILGLVPSRRVAAGVLTLRAGRRGESVRAVATFAAASGKACLWTRARGGCSGMRRPGSKPAQQAPRQVLRRHVVPVSKIHQILGSGKHRQVTQHLVACLHGIQLTLQMRDTRGHLQNDANGFSVDVSETKNAAGAVANAVTLLQKTDTQGQI
jgi:hypothetical protein